MKTWTLRAVLFAAAVIGAACIAWILTRPALPVPIAGVPTSPVEIPTSQEGTVVAVVDGDTLDVRLDTRTVRVRVLGIDTPEIGRRGKGDDCFAQEARTFLNERAFGKTVHLEVDPSQADTDKYGRLIRYVLQDGQDLARAALAAGMGAEYTYDRPYARQADYRATEATARETRTGLWGACTKGPRR